MIAIVGLIFVGLSGCQKISLQEHELYLSSKVFGAETRITDSYVGAHTTMNADGKFSIYVKYDENLDKSYFSRGIAKTMFGDLTKYMIVKNDVLCGVLEKKYDTKYVQRIKTPVYDGRTRSVYADVTCQKFINAVFGF
ncbi:MAG: hypothetical protein INF16_10525 [Methylobacterium sp.]|jgi:hypothetical protein|nr:hypothetical protein [Methylobacterium sp.]MCA3643125.1 hypothetical protein [Methylobacterium sp.]